MSRISVFLLLFSPSAIYAFAPISFAGLKCSNMTLKTDRIRITMVGNGGQGWRNDDFLSSLGSNEEERDRVAGEYKDFKKSRESFQKRQMERMNSPEFKRFQEQLMSQRLQRQEVSDAEDSDGGFFEDMGIFQGREESRFGNMMRQAQMKQSMGPNDFGSIYSAGFEQKFGVPLDDDDIEDEESD